MISSQLTKYNTLFFERVEKHLSKKNYFAKTINIAINIIFNLLVTLVIFVREGRRRKIFASAKTATQGEFKNNHSKLVVLLAETNVGSLYRYRVEPKIRFLEKLGFSVALFSVQNSLAALPFLAHARFVILYRVPFNPLVDRVIAEAKNNGLDLFYDIDDLIFEKEAFSDSAMMRSLSAGERKEHLRAAEHYFQALQLCDYGIASTQEIAKAMKKHLSKDIFLLENGILPDLLAASEKPRPKLDKKMVWIGYGSGSKTHDADFKVCAEAILRVLEKYPHAGLVVHGALDLPDGFAKFDSRVRRVGFMSAAYYYRSIGLFDINIAPLAIDLFNEAKSNLKFIEAALFSVPTVASPSEPFRKAIDSGKNGFLATTTGDWESNLSRLVESAQLRLELGRAARDSALHMYGFEAQERSFIDIFGKYLPNTVNWHCGLADEEPIDADIQVQLLTNNLNPNLHVKGEAIASLNLDAVDFIYQLEAVARAAKNQTFSISLKASLLLANNLEIVSRFNHVKIIQSSSSRDIFQISDPRESQETQELGRALSGLFSLTDCLESQKPCCQEFQRSLTADAGATDAGT
jgi:glycosyltransferase involved in cell wall biosynthesis